MFKTMEQLYYDQNMAIPAYEDTNENYEPQQVDFECFDINPVYSPAQVLKPKKKHSLVPFELEAEPIFKRKAAPRPKKKVCTETNNPNSTAQNSENEAESSDLEQPFCELDLLFHSIGLEQLRVPQIPTAQQVHDLWAKVNPTYKNSENQEEFLSMFLEKDSILKVRMAMDDEIANGAETQQFQQWVEGICMKDNAKIIKEMARRQKVYRYLQKKHGRSYCKKVHYQIRQRVAEERLRVKGRFVTWSQALDMLDENNNKKQYNIKDYYTIKKKLKEKFGSCKIRP